MTEQTTSDTAADLALGDQVVTHPAVVGTPNIGAFSDGVTYAQFPGVKGQIAADFWQTMPSDA
jgi:hypothetical protein